MRRAGDAEVGDERALAAALEQDVLGADVAVDDARAVRVGERPGDLAQHARRLAGEQRPARADPLAERRPLDERHDHVDEARRARRRAYDGHDVRMRERGGGLRLAQERLAQLGALGERGREDLDRDGPSEPDLAREVDDAHAAAADLAVERVLAGERGLEGDEVCHLRDARVRVAGCAVRRRDASRWASGEPSG